MDFDNINFSRNKYNRKCIDLLNMAIINYPELRIEQIIYILDNEKDYFNEEPIETYHRWISVKPDLFKVKK